MTIETKVYRRNEAQFDAAGVFLGYSLRTLPESISRGLAHRLVYYAIDRMEESGFGSILKEASVEVYTMNGDDRPADRAYTVRFTTHLGGYVELSGILTKNGWPSLDHNFNIGCD